jgi:hypothetical protein
MGNHPGSRPDGFSRIQKKAWGCMGQVKNRTGKGRFVCYFEHTKQLYFRTYDELRSIIGKK